MCFYSGRRLRVALVADPLTRACLVSECELADVTPDNYKEVLVGFKPDFLFFESVWHGHEDSWKFKVASYPWFRFRSNKAVAQLTHYARRLGIPTVFWNKEDGAHFERFIDSAALFDTLLTVDQNCIPRCHERLGPKVKLGVMPFAEEPVMQHPLPQSPRLRRANFVGTYNRVAQSRRHDHYR